MRNNVLLLAVTAALAFCLVCADTYEEELTLKPLNHGFVEAYFEFTTHTNIETLSSGHYHLFPKPLGEILYKYNVSELSVSLTQGMWRQKQWGFPLTNSAPGAEVLVFFNEGTVDVTQKWKDLVNTLAGLFCASLNFIDKAATVKPEYSFRPRGAVDSGYKFNKELIRYAVLPQENVCTENLTPWSKLLPCHGKAGLSSLFKAKALYDSAYHSLSLHYQLVCSNEDCTERQHSLTQQLLLTFEPVIKTGKSDRWTLNSLFGADISAKCAVADRSEVIVETEASPATSVSVEPAPSVTRQIHGQTVSVYNVQPGLQITATRKSAVSRDDNSPAVYTHRFLAGYGQEKGSIQCKIVNTLDDDIQIVYMENIPWFLRTFLHTLTISTDGVANKPVKMLYTPARERNSPHLLELLLDIPANSTTTISIEFEMLFLKWTEYPPDANHGFYVPSAVILAALPDVGERFGVSRSRGFTNVRIYTEKLLVSLPTPDFSMPYNVICLACTVVAIGFGSFHSLFSKTFVKKEEQKGLVKRVVSAIRNFFSKSPPANSEQKLKDE